MFLTNNASGYSIDSTAIKAFSESRYFEASILFERAIYYENDINEIARNKYFKALCYKYLEDYDRSIDELNSINTYKTDDTLFARIKYEQAFVNYLRNDFRQAKWNIQELNVRKDIKEYPELLVVKILCCNSLREWDEAMATWKTLIYNSGLPFESVQNYILKTDTLYSKGNLPKSYSDSKARNLSRFIPGSGQIYCGKVFEGIFNFIIHASLITYSVYEFTNQFYITGYLAGLGLLNKFYFGGIHRASVLADRKNNEVILEFNKMNMNLIGEILKE